MTKFKWLSVSALLLIGMSVNAQEFPAALDASNSWSFSVDIAAPDGTYIMNGPQLYLLNNLRLLVIVPLDKYVTDAVNKRIKFVWLVSDDGGITWEALKKGPADFVTLGPDQGPVRALRLRDGTLLATASPGWENFPESQREKLSGEGYYLFDHKGGNAPGIVSVIRKVIMSRSRDGGKTWETKNIKLPFMAEIALYGNAIVLSDGTYIQPGWGVHDLKKEPKWVSSLVLRTTDDGDHWEVATVAKAKDFDFNETSITQAPNADLVAVMRTTAQKELWTAISNDRGKTWSVPHDSGMRGSTPWIVTTDKGLVVAVYSRRQTTLFPTTGMYACVSRDNGQSWEAEHQAMIRDNGSAFVDGYPQAVALPDGSVFAVYSLTLSVSARTGSKKGLPGSTKNQLSIGGTRFSPIYQGPPVLSFDYAPGVLK